MTAARLAFAAVLAASVAPSAWADITFALGIPATGGQIVAIGAQAQRGTEAAVEAINAAGGIRGEKVVLQIADDACDPKQAVSVANQMASRGIKFVVGHLCSGASIAASNVYAEEGILMITASATAPELTERDLPLVFRACGRDDQQGTVAGRFIADKFPNARIAIVDDKQVYGHGLAVNAQAALTEHGKTPVFTGAVNAGERDFSAIVSRLKQERVDVVYYGGYHTELGLIVRQARQAGLDARFMGADGLATAEFWSITGQAGAGTLFTFTADAKSRPEASAALARLKQGDAQPDNFTFYYYAATTALADAIKDVGPDPQAVARDLHAKAFPTVVGAMRFDAKGDLIDPQCVIYEWKDGHYAPTKL